MIGRKRKSGNTSKSSKKNKHITTKSYEDKKKNFEDEELGGSDSSGDEGYKKNKKTRKDGYLNDDFFVQDNKLNNDNITSDEKRLKMAKNLINQIKDENPENEDDNDEKIDKIILEKIKEEKHQYTIDCTTALSPEESCFYKGHLSSITCLEITKDSKNVITGSKDCSGIKWDIETGKKFVFPKFMKKPILSLGITPDDKYVFFAGKDKFIHQIDILNEKLVNSFKAHNDSITGIKFDPVNDQFYTISKDMTFKVWALANLKNPVFLETFWGHTNKISDIDVLNSNRIITCGFDKQVNLWKVDTESFMQFKSPDSYSVDNISVINPDNFVTSSYEGNLFLWKTTKKKPIFKLNNSHGFSKSFDFNDRSGCNNLIENNIKLSFKEENIHIPYPVLSLGAIRYSDLVFTGSHNGLINFYQIDKDNKSLQLLKQFKTRLGCVNSLKIDKANNFMVIGYGKDSRLGRWETEKNAKTGISIIKLFNNSI